MKRGAEFVAPDDAKKAIDLTNSIQEELHDLSRVLDMVRTTVTMAADSGAGELHAHTIFEGVGVLTGQAADDLVKVAERVEELWDRTRGKGGAR